MGYHLAGFEVVGVDIEPQPNYPFEFYQRDALSVLPHAIADPWGAIHASPPCQAYSTLSSFTTREYPRLVEPVRELLEISGLPYVVENVVGAPLINPIRLCGSSFGLRVWRHRLFEMTNPPAMVPPCSHHQHPKPLDVTGTGGPSSKPRVKPGGGLSRKPKNLADAREAMGIDWMTRSELAEAIPPAFTEWIGRHLMAEINAKAEAA
jgi:DNA (cytosine-5)-methyltransferase 1